MALILRYAVRSDVGSRAKNDDSAYVGQNLAVVADGMGGHAGGNIASASTVLDLVHLDHQYDGDAATILADEIQTANSLLSELVGTNPQLAGMGTTCTALLLDGNHITLAHIGDSRAYRLKDNVFEQMSIDHTFVQRLIDEGRLRPEEAEVHPHKNVLMRVLGDVDASPELDVETYDAVPGEKWLLCSDGLMAVLRDAAIEQVFRESSSLRECVNTLVELTLAGGAPDNVTVAVIEVAEATEDDSVVPVVPPEPVRVRARVDGDDDTVAPGPAVEDSQARKQKTTTVDDTIRADMIRRDLAQRPHELVGSAALATETGQIPIVTKQSNERRAAKLLMHKAPEHDGSPLEETPDQRDSPRRRWVIPTFLALMTLILIAVLGFGYLWTQTRYYVSAVDDRVAIFNGVSQTLGPIELSQVTDVTEIPVSSLPEYSRDRLETTLPARDLEHAQEIVDELRCTARAVTAPSPESDTSPEPKPEPTSSTSSKASPSPSASKSTSSSSSPTSSPTSSVSPSAPAISGEAAARRCEGN
ncbi:PP2C family protein-serine/threonine phosphatase [Arthrobacter roseus]|uniref:PP2C family protein-serine/threonine phosphatase n=1 Tax=Arthrobacter roseus TaxID=136274 RepID=UPI00196406CF|nr:protein phosphatase 2C domain-containing protein [Arthrobacter roseus]MBM7847178.1 protein phosphatase [Arthrobacter roseus]